MIRTCGPWRCNLSISSFWITFRTLPMSHIIRQIVFRVSDPRSVFPKLTSYLWRCITSEDRGDNHVTSPSFPPPSFRLHHCLNRPIVSWSCWDSDQVIFSLLIWHYYIICFISKAFHGHSSGPHRYHRLTFPILSDSIIPLLLPFKYKLLSIKSMYFVNFNKKKFPHFPTSS